jgi:hypothetical protein
MQEVWDTCGMIQRRTVRMGGGNLREEMVIEKFIILLELSVTSDH